MAATSHRLNIWGQSLGAVASCSARAQGAAARLLARQCASSRHAGRWGAAGRGAFVHRVVVDDAAKCMYVRGVYRETSARLW